MNEANSSGVLTETHLHTAEGSSCARVPAKEIAALYKNAGYGGIVVTDHWGKSKLERYRGDAKEKNARWLEGYRTVHETGSQMGLRVFFGLELALDAGPEDFLVYGLKETFVDEHTDLYHYPIAEVYAAIDAAGGLIFQAHPYRIGQRPQPPECLHGMEIFNGNPRHQSHNDDAAAYAAKHGLLTSAGSDFHEYEDLARGGIFLPESVTSEARLAEYLKSGRAAVYVADRG
ncbi:MAG: transposase [Clostridiales bacterium]|jgi:predicted metal-dependent phosphoesterase TrpH|nr:transposase [Clostridiales bacterium]